MRGIGLASLAGSIFLLQELIRVLLNLRALGGEPSSGGALDLSDAATPAAWLYWAGHAWLLAFICRWRSEFRPPDWILSGVLAGVLLAVHSIVLGPLRPWSISPRLL